jgi:hypothetical protein
LLSRGHGRDNGTRGAPRQLAQAFSRGRPRAILFLVLLLVVPVIVVTSPIDTLWNTGWYDDADPDQLLTMAAEGLTGLAVLALACLVASACLESEVALRQHIPSGREPVPRDNRGRSPRFRLGSFFDLSYRRSVPPVPVDCPDISNLQRRRHAMDRSRRLYRSLGTRLRETQEAGAQRMKQWRVRR